MNKKLILDSLKYCNTFLQLGQVHAHAITTGVMSRHSSYILPNILYKITRLSDASHVKSSRFSTFAMMNYAVSVFNLIVYPTTFCYNTMMRLYTLLSSPLSALFVFTHMRRASILPDFHTFPFAIKASGHLRSRSITSALHSQTLKFGFISDLFVHNSILHVYAICGFLRDARVIFEENEQKDIVSHNALLDGFVKVGDTKQARELFDKMTERDSISWGTLIAGYAQSNQPHEAIDLFNRMLHFPNGVSPDNIALVSVLSACAQLGDLERGRSVHEYIIQNGIKVNSFLATGLVDLYAKCGCIETSLKIFETSTEKNIFTWNAVLVGLALHGHGRTCLDYFYEMVRLGIHPDGVSFLGVLVGCTHAGLIGEARQLFQSMEPVYGVARESKHYGCMADLLARAGLVMEALEIIKGMPIPGDIYAWGGLLAGCRKHGLIEIAEEIANNIRNLCPEDGGVYSVMVNMYANLDMWDDVIKTRSSMKTRKVEKNVACSLIKVDGIAHEFIAGDFLHPQSDEIYKVLSGLGKHQLES